MQAHQLNLIEDGKYLTRIIDGIPYHFNPHLLYIVECTLRFKPFRGWSAAIQQNIRVQTEQFYLSKVCNSDKMKI